MNNSNEFQSAFLNEVKEKLPPGESLAKYLSRALNVNLPNTYRRINGETALSLSELLQLAKEFHISIDSLLQANTEDMAVFKRDPFILSMENVSEYFKSSRETLIQLKKSKDVHLFYAARDVPIFYFMTYPTLCRFKVFVWLKRPEHEDILKEEKFEFNQVSQEVLDAGAKTAQEYYDIPKTEIWTEQTVQNVVEQVKYYYNGGSINKEAATQICDEIMDLLDTLHRKLINEAGKDMETTKLKLYYSNFLLLENGIVAQVKDRKRAYISYSGINFMYTDHKLFCQQIMDRFNDHKSRSVLLNSTSTNIRNRFFNKCKQRVEFIKEQIQRDSELR